MFGQAKSLAALIGTEVCVCVRVGGDEAELMCVRVCTLSRVALTGAVWTQGRYLKLTSCEDQAKFKHEETPLGLNTFEMGRWSVEKQPPFKHAEEENIQARKKTKVSCQ